MKQVHTDFSAAFTAAFECSPDIPTFVVSAGFDVITRSAVLIVTLIYCSRSVSVPGTFNLRYSLYCPWFDS
jgi:hypothetical protein